MIHVEQAIVVEGKYDRIHLAAFVDAPILETGGFRIYKDKEKIHLLRRLAHDKGLIIITDPDAAGFQIRGFLRSVLGDLSRVTEVYIPAIEGKEKRKANRSKEGLLGVEGVSEVVLEKAFQKAGVGVISAPEKWVSPIASTDFYEWGFAGTHDSHARRLKLLEKLDFPPYLSTKSLLEALNLLYTKDEFTRWMENDADFSMSFARKVD